MVSSAQRHFCRSDNFVLEKNIYKIVKKFTDQGWEVTIMVKKNKKKIIDRKKRKIILTKGKG